MEAFSDEAVNEISVMCSAQSAKTLTMLCLVNWEIAEDPGPTLWVTANKQMASRFSKGRMLPMLQRCGPIIDKFPKDRRFNTTLEIYFPGAPLVLTGSESDANLQSTPYRYVFMDEARSYPPGALERIRERITSYTHNYKLVFISTPADEQDAVHRAFLSGDQRRWEIKCPACGHYQELAWKEPGQKGGLKWDTTEDDVIILRTGERITCRVLPGSADGQIDTRIKDGGAKTFLWSEVAGVERATKPDGKYDFDRLSETIRYECEACDHRIHDTPAERKPMCSEGGGRWVIHNPKARSNIRSFHWNKLLPWWTNWDQQVRAFLAAKVALKWGDHLPMKQHINEHRGIPWTDRHRYAHDEKFIHLRLRPYNPREKWDPEVRRFATIDVQGKGGRHFYQVIRAWGLYGQSRLLHWAKVWSIEELRQLHTEWHVSPDNVALDCANWSSEVYKYVIESGYRWKAFRGDEKPFFKVADRNFIFTTSDADPAIGTAMERRVRPIRQFLWSKPSALDRLANFQHGINGDWQLPQAIDGVVPSIDVAGAPEEIPYSLQATAYDRRYRVDARGVEHPEWHKKRDDHYASCELMQIICAAVTEILSPPRDPLFAGAAEPAAALPVQD